MLGCIGAPYALTRCWTWAWLRAYWARTLPAGHLSQPSSSLSSWLTCPLLPPFSWCSNFFTYITSCPRLQAHWTNFCILLFSKPKLFAAVFILSHLPSPVSSGDSGVSVSFVFCLLLLASLVYYLPLLLDLSSACWKYTWLLIPCPLCAGDWTQNLARQTLYL